MKFDVNTLKSTSFWASAATIIAIWISTTFTNLNGRWAVIASTAVAGLYALSRGIAKKDTDLKRGWHTTEFWLGVIQVALIVIAGIENNIPPRYAAMATAALTGLYALARSLAVPTPSLSVIATGDVPVDDPTVVDGDDTQLPPPPPAK